MQLRKDDKIELMRLAVQIASGKDAGKVIEAYDKLVEAIDKKDVVKPKE